MLIAVSGRSNRHSKHSKLAWSQLSSSLTCTRKPIIAVDLWRGEKVEVELTSVSERSGPREETQGKHRDTLPQLLSGSCRFLRVFLIYKTHLLADIWQGMNFFFIFFFLRKLWQSAPSAPAWLLLSNWGFKAGWSFLIRSVWQWRAALLQCEFHNQFLHRKQTARTTVHY